MDLALIALVDMGVSGGVGGVSNPYCRYTESTDGSGFNYIGGHEFQYDVLIPLL